jgi:hypothetical protein
LHLFGDLCHAVDGRQDVVNEGVDEHGRSRRRFMGRASSSTTTRTDSMLRSRRWLDDVIASGRSTLVWTMGRVVDAVDKYEQVIAKSSTFGSAGAG